MRTIISHAVAVYITGTRLDKQQIHHVCSLRPKNAQVNYIIPRLFFHEVVI